MGRKPVKEIKSKYQKRKERREAAERDQVKEKFGHGKRGYELNDISQIIYDIKRLDKGYHFCDDEPVPAHEEYSSVSIYRFADERNKKMKYKHLSSHATNEIVCLIGN